MPSQNHLNDNIVSPAKPISPPQSKSRERKGPPQKVSPAPSTTSSSVQLAALGPKFPTPMNRTGSSEGLSSGSVAALPGAPLTGNSLDMTLIPTSLVQPLANGDDGKNKGVNKIFGIVKGIFEREANRIEISSPYNPVHLTHVGYNQDTGELTGLPKEWQVLLTEAGITKEQQLANPQAVFDIINFYSAANGGNLDDEVWSKFSKAQALAKIAPGTPPKSISPEDSPRVPVKPKRDVPEKPPQEKRKPPIPERPKHTLTIYSTDLKPVEPQVNK
ncbi:p21 protein (Cdc42 Rac)-activated kinase, partial [Nowakowskiella sp. JEL0078]